MFGQRIRELRKRAGLTQTELAVRCGAIVEMQSIGAIERGERNCTLRTIETLTRALKCEPAELFLFRPQHVGRWLSAADARLADRWKAADNEQKQKIIRKLSELV